jgi:hypothetical protein
VVSGGLLMGLVWFLSWLLGAGAADGVVAYGSLGLLGIVMGAGLLASGLRAVPVRGGVVGRGGPGIMLAAFAVTLVVGQALLAGPDRMAGLAMPPIQLAAALSAALAIVATAVWRTEGAGSLAVWSGLAWGACIAAGVALVVEAGALGTAALGVAAAARIQGWEPELQATLRDLGAAVSGGGQVDRDALVALLLRPAVVAAAALVLGLAGPLTEELTKGMAAWVRRPATAHAAWVCGVTAGAGFGITEAVGLGSLSLDRWAAGMSVRAAAMVMHATMTGLAGLAWYAAFVEMRRLRALGLLAIAVAGHSMWNLLVLAAVLFGAVGGTGAGDMWSSLAGAAAAGLAATFTVVFLSFRAISRRLAGGAVPPVPA